MNGKLLAIAVAKVLGTVLIILAVTELTRRLVLWLAQRALQHLGVYPANYKLKSHLGPSIGLFFLALYCRLALNFFDFPHRWADIVAHFLSILLISASTWFLIRVMNLATAIIFGRLDVTVSDNLVQRKLRTQVGYIQNIIVILIGVFGLCMILLTFNEVRQVGLGVLTSAGLAGIVLGFAAQKSLGNLIAGFQIAFTQPIRLDDVVIVENEWGRIEDITLTYVVVRIWDLRRLILPITYFVEKPFQNWTRTSSDLLGYIYLYSDYSLPVDKLRAAFTEFLAQSPLWDNKVSGVQVTNATEKVMEIRLLMSAKDSSSQWDLRCLAREKMISWIQDNYPQCLPRTRIEPGPVFVTKEGPDRSQTSFEPTT